mmetsp:Transcript_18010/g.38408  ORF Transcript_18010/g.38408 Transcript_18010/m.38408 type:complete len:588 (+) Transcript_18010:3-1766(+)
MIIDMLIAVAIPMFFGGLATVLREASPKLRSFASILAKRGEVERTVCFERRVNAWGYSAGAQGQDHLLQKALMMYASKHSSHPKGISAQQHGMLTLTELPAKQQKKDASSKQEEYYDSDDERAGGVTELTNMEVSTMPPLATWIDVGDGLQLRKTREDGDGDEKSQVRKESTTITLRASGKGATERINAYVDRAYAWYKGTLEEERDEKRYMFMMLHMPPVKSDEDKGSAVRLYKRYELSNEKTFESLFFPDKKELLYLLDHFQKKSGKFAIPGFPHKLGLLLYGPPGTGKTSLIKAIAHHTKRHIVSVPLSKIKTNQELMDVMFDQSFRCVNTSKSKNDDDSEISVALTFKKVIFVMEDVDAASKVVQRRAPKPEATTTTVTTKVTRGASHAHDGEHLPSRRSSAADTPLLRPSKSPSVRAPAPLVVPEEGEVVEEAEVVEEEKVVVVEKSAAESGVMSTVSKYDKLYEIEDKLDLAGLLNVLDGVVDSPNRIVIMTTNHPEKLDPALIRPGRINKQVLMGYLYPDQALEMVRHYFGDVTEEQAKRFRMRFIPNVFTPAQVEQLCAEHDTVEDFLVGLDGLKANQY